MSRFLFLSTLQLVALLVIVNSTRVSADDRNADCIKPSARYPHYWQYKGKPVLLLGGSKDDSLFQIPNLREHLDEIQAAGGNYIRNTMSDRPDHDFEVYAFRRLPSGKYDLNQWNDEYWRRLENLLKWTDQRDIIVQIEVWDRFDYSDHRGFVRWAKHPYNPRNNVNYTSAHSGLAVAYTEHHPSRDKQPFFHSVPGMQQYLPTYDVIRRFQEQYVAKLLSYSLQYGNVLYCMNNETTTDLRWGQYWMKFIRDRAAKAGVEVYATDMFDDVWRPKESEKLRLVLDNPKLYPFLDISQVNSRTFNEDHWTNLDWIMRQARKYPRPLNHTKIYSDGETSFGSGTPQDGVERFWRNLIAGSASCRFHRPTSGIGLNDTAKACIGAARKAESVIKLWDVEPCMDLLRNREPDEAYLAANPGRQYLLYFTDGGSVEVDLSHASETLQLTWIDISTGTWGDEATLRGGGYQTIVAPGKGGWVAVIVGQKGS